jgi:hypothetical protein
MEELRQAVGFGFGVRSGAIHGAMRGGGMQIALGTRVVRRWGTRRSDMTSQSTNWAVVLRWGANRSKRKK